MNYFKKFSSNTYAGCGSQLFFTMAESEVRTARSFYKISVGGHYNYSLLFSNIIDATYYDGSISRRNLICDGYTIHSAKIGKCKFIPTDKDITEMSVGGGGADINVTDFVSVTFAGNASKEVMPGEMFCTDPVSLNFDKGEYLCLEMTFSGKILPHNADSILPSYIKCDDGWKYSKEVVLATMVGCDRAVKSRVAYLGDSITQGVGTSANAYAHWCALLSEKLGEYYSYWNLGIGYGRANDAASDSIWLYKAKQNDIIFVCFGVNDLVRGLSAEQIKSDLAYIVDTLKKLGKTVILQTVPPFNYQGATLEAWLEVCSYIKTELAQKVDAMFDAAALLGVSEDEPQKPKYGDHPTDEGNAIWADTLYEAVKKLF